MAKSEFTKARNLRAELRKAENRERIAQCKLDRLKERFDKLYGEMARSEEALTVSQSECRSLHEQVTHAHSERDRAANEALMWRTQLFERMELLEKAKLQLTETEQQLELAWEKAGQASLIHIADHEELKRRDREREQFELRIVELQRVESETKAQAADLLGALTDAESAITSLQRSNDLYQRELDGLKSIGASLTEQLNRTTAQLERQKDYSSSLQEELQAEKVHTAHLREEMERLRRELYETNGLLAAQQMESDRREGRGVVRDRGSDGQVVSTVTPATQKSAPKVFLNRATQKMSGWLRLPQKPKK